MTSKLMKRKVAWARNYAQEADDKLKILTTAQRAAFSVDTGEDRKQLALARSVIEADKRFQFIAIKDMRSSVNKRRSHEAHKRLERAYAAYAQHTGREPNKVTGSFWGLHDAIDTEIEALIKRLRATYTELRPNNHPTEETT